MSVRFVIGRAGSGKSERCLSEIRHKLLEEPNGEPLMLLVPEQATFQAEHALISTHGVNGLLRAQVLSFRRLAWRVMQETGGTAGIPIDDTGKAMLLIKLLHKHENQLMWFAGSADKMGAVSRMNELLSEMKRYQVTPESLDAIKERLVEEKHGQPAFLSNKLHDLSLIGRDFEEELARQYLDGESYLSKLAGQLPECVSLRNTEIWIDGFYGFTPQEMAAVVQLCRQTRRVTIALTLNRSYPIGELPHELDLFHPTARTMLRVRELLLDAGVTDIETVSQPDDGLPRFQQSPMLAHLEKEFERRLSPRKQLYSVSREEKPGIVIAEAVSRRAEVEGAAREMLRLVREEGLRWRDMAIRVRNIEAYGDLLGAVLADYDIPFFMDQKRSVLHHPLPELIRSALEAVLQNWRYDPIFRCVKTGFFTSAKQEPMAMDELENYVLARGIQGWRWKHDKSWELSRQVNLENGEETGREADPLAQTRLVASRNAITGPLGRLEESLHRAGSVREMTEALYVFLTDLNAPEKLEEWSAINIAQGKPEKAREHAQVWDRIVDVLDQLTGLMGDEKVEPRLFAKLIDSGLESLKLGLVPPSLDQVLIGSIDRTRSAHVKVSFVLGTLDGELPAKMKEDGILTEAERDTLARSGLELADGSRRKLLDEAFLIYTVLCASSERLWLSYPLADEEGKTLLPSEIIKQVRSLFTGLPVRMLFGEPPVSATDEEALEYVCSETRTLSYLTVQLRQWFKGESIAGIWWSVYNWLAANPKWYGRMQTLVSSITFTNRAVRLSESTSLALYGEQLRSSVSRMERFVECPFSQFASHGLRLQERKIYRLEAPDIGEFYHAALRRLVEQLYAGRMNRPLAEHELALHAEAVVNELIPRLQSEILLSTSRYQHVARKLKGIVHRAAGALSEHARQGSFVPVGLEIGFGPGEILPPLLYQLSNGRNMQIVGRIDRVDKVETEEGLLLRVIDYKSSQTALNLTEVYYGLSLQMLTYLDVLLTHSERWLGRKARPAGVLYFHVHNPLLSSKNAMTAEDAEAKAKKQLIMKGMLRADAETVRMMDAGLSGRYGSSELVDVALTKDGGFHKRSLVATDPQWEGLRGYVRQVIGEIGTELTSGNINIAPYRIGKEKACTHCAFKPVCQFDPLMPGNRFQSLERRGRDELWQAFAEASAGRTGLRINQVEDEQYDKS